MSRLVQFPLRPWTPVCLVLPVPLLDSTGSLSSTDGVRRSWWTDVSVSDPGSLVLFLGPFVHSLKIYPRVSRPPGSQGLLPS